MTDLKQLAISHTMLEPKSGHTCSDAQILAKGYLALDTLLKDICEQWNEECNPTCDSVALS